MLILMQLTISNITFWYNNRLLVDKHLWIFLLNVLILSYGGIYWFCHCCFYAFNAQNLGLPWLNCMYFLIYFRSFIVRTKKRSPCDCDLFSFWKKVSLNKNFRNQHWKLIGPKTHSTNMFKALLSIVVSQNMFAATLPT